MSKLYQYTEVVEPVFVPEPTFDWFQSPSEQPRRRPRRQAAGSTDVEQGRLNAPYVQATGKQVFPDRVILYQAKTDPLEPIAAEPIPDWGYQPPDNQPYLAHKRRQDVGASMQEFPEREPDVDWLPDTNQPPAQHKRRQAAGATLHEFPEREVDADEYLPLTNQPLFRHKRRQAAGATFPAQTTPLQADVEWLPLTSQPLFRHKRRQDAGAVRDIEPIAIEPDWGYQPPDNQPLFRHPPRQVAGAILQEFPEPEIDVDEYLPLTNQPPARHARRQAAGATEDLQPPAVVVPDWFMPQDNQPYRVHLPRQTAGMADWLAKDDPAFEDVFLVRLIDPADYPVGTEFFLELHMETDDAAKPAQGRLVRVSDGAVVPDSTTGTTSTSIDRFRSVALTLFSGSHEYRVQAGGALGGNYTIYRGALIVVVD